MIILIEFIIIAVIQTNFFDYIRINGIEPNLILVFIVCFSIFGDVYYGAFIGAVGGMVQDIVMGRSLGGYTLMGMLLGLIIGISKKRFVKESLVVAMGFVFVFSILYESAMFLFFLIPSGETDFIYAFTKTILPEALYNMILAVVVFPIILETEKRIKGKNRIAKY